MASGRLRFVDPQTLLFSLKTPWADGTTSLLLSPTELIEKLAALVPPPRRNLIRYHGVLAPAAADRAQIVPGPSALTAAEVGCDHDPGDASTVGVRRHRVEWAKLLRRVFQFDVTKCDACGGPMKGIAALTERGAIRKYLDHVGLPCPRPAHRPGSTAPTRIRRSGIGIVPGSARRPLEPTPLCSSRSLRRRGRPARPPLRTPRCRNAGRNQTPHPGRPQGATFGLDQGRPDSR